MITGRRSNLFKYCLCDKVYKDKDNVSYNLLHVFMLITLKYNIPVAYNYVLRTWAVASAERSRWGCADEYAFVEQYTI